MIRVLRAVLVLLTLLTLPVWAHSQQGSHEHGGSASAAEKSGKAAVPESGKHHGRHGMRHCKEMMAKHDKMVEEMKAMDARLEEKLAAVKSGKTTDQKVTALEAVVVELSMQRKQIHGLMADMQHAGMKCGGKGCGMMHGKGHGKKCPMMDDKSGAPGAMHQEGKGGMDCCAMMRGQQGHGVHSGEAAAGETGA